MAAPPALGLGLRGRSGRRGRRAELAAHLGFGSAELERAGAARASIPDAARCTRTAPRTSTSCVPSAARSRTRRRRRAARRRGGVLARARACGRREPRGDARTAAGRAWSAASTRCPARATPARCRSTSAGSTACSRSTRPRAPRASRPGATGPRLEEQLAEHGMTLRFFPQSFELSTLGGWIATRAAGHFATGPTHIDDLVESVRAITPRGDVWESRRLPGSGAGPSPDRLLLGSEGTLAVITEAWVRDPPARRAALERPRRARRLRDRARADAGDRPGRPAAVQLPADRARARRALTLRRRRHGAAAARLRGRPRRPVDAARDLSPRPAACPRAAAAAGARRSCARRTCATRWSRWACSPRRSRPRSRGTGCRR